MSTNYEDVEEIIFWVQNTLSCNGLECPFADLPVEQQTELINLLMKYDESDDWMSDILDEEQIESLRWGEISPDSMPGLFYEIQDRYYEQAQQLYDNIIYRWDLNNDYN